MYKRGFTLVELLIVLTVIAIIVAIIIPSLRGMRIEGYITQAESELKTLQSGVTSYFRHNNVFPDNIHSTLVGASPQIVTEILKDPFKTDDSTDPATYGYDRDPDGDSDYTNYYVIYSNGPDETKDWSWNGTDNKVTGKDDDIVVSNAPVEK